MNHPVIVLFTEVAGGVTFNDTYTLDTGSLTLGGGGGTLDVENGASVVITSVIGGSVGLTNYGDGTLTLTGANTFSGTVNCNSIAGLVVDSDARLGNASNGISFGVGKLIIAGNFSTSRAIT